MTDTPKYKVGDRFRGSCGVYTVGSVVTSVVHSYRLACTDGHTATATEEGPFFQRITPIVPWFEAGKRYQGTRSYKGEYCVVHVKAAWEVDGRRFAAGHLVDVRGGVHPWTRDEDVTDEESYYDVYTEVTE